MKRFLAVFAVLAAGAMLLSGCGKAKKDKASPKASAEEASVARVDAVDVDPERIVAEVWQALLATNVEAVVARSVDAGLDLTPNTVDETMQVKRYRDLVSAAAECYAGATLASVACVEDHGSRRRMQLTVTHANGSEEQVDCLLRKAGATWRVDLLAN